MNHRRNRPQPSRPSLDPRPHRRRIVRERGLGQRWAGPRPLLVGPMIGSVLRRALRPMVFHRTDVRLGVSNSFVVDDRRHTSIHWKRIDQQGVPATPTPSSGRQRPVARHLETSRGFHQRLLRAPTQPRVEAMRPQEERRSTAGEFTQTNPSIRHRTPRPDRPDALASRPRAATSVPVSGSYAPAVRPTLGRDHRRPKVSSPSLSLSPTAVPTHAETPQVDRGRAAPPASIDVDDLTRRVVDAIDRRLISHRERMGRR